MDLKATLNLPKTDFPMKANLPQEEPRRIERWRSAGLYGQLRAARADAGDETGGSDPRSVPAFGG